MKNQIHMTEEDREIFEERAAIMEYDGQLPRFEAEIMAAKIFSAWSNKRGSLKQR